MEGTVEKGSQLGKSAVGAFNDPKKRQFTGDEKGQNRLEQWGQPDRVAPKMSTATGGSEWDRSTTINHAKSKCKGVQNPKCYSIPLYSISLILVGQKQDSQVMDYDNPHCPLHWVSPLTIINQKGWKRSYCSCHSARFH